MKYDSKRNAALIYEEAKLSSESSVNTFRIIDEAKKSEELVPLLNNEDPYILRHVIHKLGELNSENSQILLIELWEHGNADKRYANQNILSSSISKAALIRELVRILGSSYIDVNYLISLADDRETVVRADAAVALGYFEDIQAFEYLLVMTSDVDHHVALKAIQSIEDLAGEAVDNNKKQTKVEAMIELMKVRVPTDPDISHRYNLLYKKLISGVR